MRLQEGQAAPAIRGETTRGMRIAPEAFRGKTVLLKHTARSATCISASTSGGPRSSDP